MTHTRIIINCTTNEVEEIPVTDDYIRQLSPQVKITIANTTKQVGQSEPVTLQLVTRPLTDGITQESVVESRNVLMQFGDIEQSITLDSNGAYSDTLEFSEVGLYTVKCIDLASNEVTIEVL